jgi:hypothetical protein
MPVTGHSSLITRHCREAAVLNTELMHSEGLLD